MDITPQPTSSNARHRLTTGIAGLFVGHSLLAGVQLGAFMLAPLSPVLQALVFGLSILGTPLAYAWMRQQGQAKTALTRSLLVWVLVMALSLTAPPLLLIASGRTAYDVGMTGYFAFCENPTLGLAPVLVLLGHLAGAVVNRSRKADS